MLIIFWIVAALMTAVILFFLLRPLIKPSTNLVNNRNQQVIAIYKDKLKELDNRFSLNEIDEDVYQQTRAELEHTLLTELPDSESNIEIQNQAQPIITTLVIAIATPLVAIIFYITLGSPTILNPEKVSTLQNSAEPDINTMMQQLIDRLQNNPDDIQGWLTLGRSYVALQRFDDAKKVFIEAYNRAPENVDAMLGLAEALAHHNNGNLRGQSGELIRKAMQVDPQSKNANLLLGVLNMQEGNTEKALSVWENMLESLPLAEDEAKLVRVFISRAEQNSSKPPVKPETTSPVELAVKVSLDKSLLARTDPSDIVFIFARAANGPPMPLAVVKQTVRDLPTTVLLTDKQAMMPDMKLSNFSEVIVGARISKTGNAIPSSGDLQGLSKPLALSTTKFSHIKITDVVP